MNPARIGIVVGMTVVGLAFAIWLIGSLPGIPYNLQELVADQNPVMQAVLLSCTLYALFGIPAVIARLAQLSSRAILILPLLLIAEAAILWLFLRSAVPAESIHDILGNPVLDWPWEWEYLFRLSGLVIGSGVMLAGSCLLTAALLRTERAAKYRTLVSWAVLSVPLLALSYWIIVEQAATDNLTELMVGGGSWQATLFIAMWMVTAGLAGALVSARLATGQLSIPFVVVLVLLSFPAAYGCLRLGLEQEVHKYDQVFSALQFLLSTDRANLASGFELLVRLLIFHYGTVLLVAVFQYPFWAYRTAPPSTGSPQREQKIRRRRYRLPPGFAAPLAYGCLVIYGTLYPFDAWQVPRRGTFAGVLAAWPEHVSLADIFSNAVIYLPLGLLLTIPLRKRFSTASCIGLVSTAGLLLSWTLEYLQYSIPFRNTSSLDLGLNVLGTAAGAAVALVASPQHAFGHRLQALRHTWFQPGRGPNVALAATGLWVLASTFPFVPSIDIGSLRQGIAPLWAALQNPASVSLQLITAHTLSFFGMGQLVMLAAISASRIRDAYTGLLILIVLLAVPVMERSLEAETLVALLAAVFLLYTVGTSKSKRGSLLASAAIITAYIAQNLNMPAGAAEAQTATFNWVPFAGQLGNVTRGLADILENSWPFAALAYLVWNWLGGRFYRTPAAGAALVFLAVLAINLQQQFIPGRYPDITDVIVATAAWLTAWHLLRHRTAPAATERPRAATRNTIEPPATVLLITGVLMTLPLVSLVLGAIVSLGAAPGSPGHELQEPGDLPPAPLTQFHHEHPRLPTPSAKDIATLRSQNPAYLRQLSRKARGERGKADAIVKMAFIEPGSQDLDSLLDRLLAIEFRERAGGEVKQVVLAYDWLHQQWNPEQLAQLRSKVADGCEHLIRFTREKRLSPYNVILYNTLLQDLVACAIVLYDDDSRGAPVMAFAYDLLKNRVLPVWRQVMGSNGGWHEGGEYVGIGIGQAIYQVPAMWRKATGEDLFSTEPGMRGFLDFLIYRTRPDKTHFRWGDGSHFDRQTPARIPLAIEYRHTAAYSLNGCPRRVVPTSWPWGPLTDDTLCDPGSVSRLPLARYFDGIGMLVARSDWSPDATYVSFKAGDNYWSHTHLDQGSFTVFQGGALAIDSGAYGGGGHYGSDHHMNYAYQTIAHNAVTVHDPDDTVAAPRDEEPPRQIANDGGQRRIGSGWGIESAPLDLNEWLQKRDIYHTGTMEKIFIEDDLVIAVADLAPAYTNSESGKGTFSHRTRRVEQFNRTFGFDMTSGAILIFDRVRASSPDFRKRWLHHSIEKPELTAHGYTIKNPVKDRIAGQGTSRLDAHVLLPRDPDIALVGGAGHEFYVEGRNYDEGGKTFQSISKKKTPVEAGHWRIELSPSVKTQDDLFMVVLLPHKTSELPPYQVRLLEKDSRIGCEIVSPHRTTRWWFDSSHRGPLVEVTSDDDRHRVYDARVAADDSEPGLQ
ncbi:MAG: VanZ family protein [Gammaproteobacteria bacterium]|nr:VanZ family protein [Gammaproteobacteria bacterium]